MSYYNLLLVLLLTGVDFVTGLIKAFKNGKFNSSRMRIGLLTKSSELVILLLMYGLEYLLPTINIALPISLVNTVTVYLLLMEIGSIIENVGAVNKPLAEKLSGLFDEFTKGEK